jgi:formyltetrahydrofolate synthetase
VAVTGEMMLMPGLGKAPQAMRVDVDDETGTIQGLIWKLRANISLLEE